MINSLFCTRSWRVGLTLREEVIIVSKKGCIICESHKELLTEGRLEGGLTKQLRALCRANLNRHIKAKHPEIAVITTRR